MTRRITRIDVEDGLALPNGLIHASPQRMMIFCRVPEGWLDGASFNADKLELLLKQLYGASWRLGNADGSRYVVKRMNIHVLSADEERAQPWLASPAKGVNMLCYDVAQDGTVRRAQPADLSPPSGD
jgi:hypothetical protein